MARQIVIDVSPGGSVQVDAQGFNGVGCAKATEQIEIALGGVAQKKSKKKPEYYAPSGGQAKNKLTF